MPNGRPPNSHLKRKLPIAPWLCWRGLAERKFAGPSWFSASVPGLKSSPNPHRKSLFKRGPKIFYQPEQGNTWWVCILEDKAWGWSLVAEGISANCWCSGHLPGSSIAIAHTAMMPTDKGKDGNAEKSNLAVVINCVTHLRKDNFETPHWEMAQYTITMLKKAVYSSIQSRSNWKFALEMAIGRSTIRHWTTPH